MKFRLPALIGTALVAASLPLAAQLTLPPEDYSLETGFSAQNIIFLTDANNDGTFDTQSQQAGMEVLKVDGVTPVYNFCAEFFVGATPPITYEVTPGFGPLVSTQQALIGAVISNAMPVFETKYQEYLALVPSGGHDPSYQTQYNELQGYAGGMQIAIWEIIEENISTFSVDNDGKLPGLTAGIFKTDFLANAPETQPGLAVNFAETFLGNIQGSSPLWTDQPGFNYYYADGGNDQDRLWVTPSVIPEPSTVLLNFIAFTFLLLLRHRD